MLQALQTVAHSLSLAQASNISLSTSALCKLNHMVDDRRIAAYLSGIILLLTRWFPKNIALKKSKKLISTWCLLQWAQKSIGKKKQVEGISLTRILLKFLVAVEDPW